MSVIYGDRCGHVGGDPFRDIGPNCLVLNLPNIQGVALGIHWIDALWFHPIIFLDIIHDLKQRILIFRTFPPFAPGIEVKRTLVALLYITFTIQMRVLLIFQQAVTFFFLGMVQAAFAI